MRRLVFVLLLAGPCGGAALQAQQPVSIPIPGHGIIEGDLHGTGARGILLVAHGGYSDRASWAKQARVLSDTGFRVLAFETRAAVALRAGQETPCLYDAVCMAVDVLAAVRYLRGQGARTIAVIGGSAGGGAAAQASVEAAAGEIDRLVLLAPMSIDTPERIKGRKLFITSREDRSGAGLRLPAIQDQYERAPEPKRLVVLEGSAHGQRMFDAPEGDRLIREILRYLAEP